MNDVERYNSLDKLKGYVLRLSGLDYQKCFYFCGNERIIAKIDVIIIKTGYKCSFALYENDKIEVIGKYTERLEKVLKASKAIS
jgi:hypothetical protein